MFCRKCGTEIDTSIRLENGTVQCPGCGAIYRPKSSAGNPQPKPTNSTPDDEVRPSAEQQPYNADYERIKKQAKDGLNKAKSAATKTGKRIAAQAREIDYDGIRDKASQGANTAKNVFVGFANDFLKLRIGKYPAWMALIAVVVLIVLISSIFGGGRYAAQYELLSRMEKAYNKQDTTALLNCIDPTVTQSIMSIASLMGVSTSDLADFIPFAELLVSNAGISMSDNWGKIKIKGLSCDTNGSSGTITYRVTWTGSGGKKTSFEDTERITKVNGKWYFAISLY